MSPSHSPPYLPLSSASSEECLLPTTNASPPSWSPPVGGEGEKVAYYGRGKKHGVLRRFANPRFIIKSTLIALGSLTSLTILLHPRTTPIPSKHLSTLHRHLSLSSLQHHFSSPLNLDSQIDPTLHLVFPLDERSHGERSCKSLLAALVHGYKPVIVNWDVVGTPDELYSAKISGVYNYISQNLSSSPSTDMFLMLDAFDIWLQQSPRALLRRYREIGAEVVIGADGWCWPNDPESEECRSAPDSKVPMGVFGDVEPPKYANSGTVLGPLSSIRHFYQRLHSALLERPTLNDQHFFNEMLPEGVKKGEIAIDYWYRLWWTTAGPGEGVVVGQRWPIDGDEEDRTIPYELVPPIAYHSLSGEIPVALHFNADITKQHYMEDPTVFWGKLWWTSKEKRFRNVVRERLRSGRIGFAHDGSERRWKDVCPSSILDLGSFH